MKEKYWVPAIERTDAVLSIISNEPRKLKLMEISEKSKINKSSLFSILNTLEKLGWIYKEIDHTYSLGAKLGLLSSKYIQQFDLSKIFDREAEKTMRKIEETIQLSILEGDEIIYLAKKEGFARVRVATEPGMRFPAHATAMGKVMLSKYTKEELETRYYKKDFERFTNYTVENVNDLIAQIDLMSESGYIIENQEAVKGFTCIAAPILNERNEIIAAVSITMQKDVWAKKSSVCKEEILMLAKSLSMSS